MAFLALKMWRRYFGANINVGAKTRGVCMEQFYCSQFKLLEEQLPQ